MPRLPNDASDQEPRLDGQLVRMYADIRVLKTSQQALEHRLFGNGQPGEIQQLWTDAKIRAEEIAKLKQVYYRVGGVAVGAMTATKVFFDYALPPLIEAIKHAAR